MLPQIANDTGAAEFLAGEAGCRVAFGIALVIQVAALFEAGQNVFHIFDALGAAA